MLQEVNPEEGGPRVPQVSRPERFKRADDEDNQDDDGTRKKRRESESRRAQRGEPSGRGADGGKDAGS